MGMYLQTPQRESDCFMLKIRPLQSWKIRKAMVKAARDRQFESKLARTLEQTVLNTWPTRPLGPATPLSTTTSTSNTNTNENTSCHKHFSTLGLQLTHHVHNPIARVHMVCALCLFYFGVAVESGHLVRSNSEAFFYHRSNIKHQQSTLIINHMVMNKT